MKKLLYIERLVIAGLLLLLLALAPAMAQNVVDKNVVEQGSHSTLAVEQKGNDYYEWDLYNIDNVNFAFVAGKAVTNGDAGFVGEKNTGASVTVLWNKPGIYFFKVTARDVNGCTNNIKIGRMEVKEVDLPIATIALPDPLGVCVGESVSFEVTFTGKGTGPWDFTYTDGTTEWEVLGVTNHYILTPNVIPTTTTNYWIKKVTDEFNTNAKYISNTITQKINPLPNPSVISVMPITGGESTCLGPYLYKVSTAPDHVYLWTVTGGTEGIDYTILDKTTESANITWTNPLAVKTFTVIFTETDPVTHCINDVSRGVTVHPLSEATIAYSPSTFCATGIASVTLIGQSDGTFSSTGGLEINAVTGEIDLAASTPNSYTITYSYASGTCNKPAPTTIIIKPVPNTSDIFEENMNAN